MAILAIILSGVAFFAPRMARAANHTITIKNFTFTPEVLNVAPGDTVTFINQETDGTIHNIRGDFTSPDLPPGASFTVTITGTRSYSYYCGVHPYKNKQPGMCWGSGFVQISTLRCSSRTPTSG